MISITSAEPSDEGQSFDLAETANQRRMFRITAEVDFVDVYGASTFLKGKKLKSSLVFRLPGE